MVATRNLLLPVAAALAIGASTLGAGPLGASMPAAAADQPPSALSAVTPNDPFGERVTLPEQNIVYVAGSGQWDSAFDTILDAFKTVNGTLGKLGVKPSGAPMTIYTSTDDAGFKFEAAVPIGETPRLPADSQIKVGKAPAGPALKFVHRGSYDAMDTTYEAITDHLEERKLEARELFVEQYMNDPVTTPDDDLVIDIYVPLKDDAAAATRKR